MPRERYKPEEIVAKLRQEVFVPAFAGVAGFATWSGSAGHASPTDSIKLGRVDKFDPDADAGKQHERGEALDQLVIAGGDAA